MTRDVEEEAAGTEGSPQIRKERAVKKAEYDDEVEGCRRRSPDVEIGLDEKDTAVQSPANGFSPCRRDRDTAAIYAQHLIAVGDQP